MAIPSLRASRLSLHDKEEIVFWRGAANGFHFRDTGRAEGIKPHAILRLAEICIQFGLQQDQVLSAEKTFEERVLRPFAKTQQNLVDFSPPAIIGNIVGDDVARRVAGTGAPVCHHLLLPDAQRRIGLDFACEIFG